MGFQVEINSILRTDEPYQLVKGGAYDFHKKGSRVFFDTIPIWLASNDWTALAEIKILAQSRTPAEVTGKFTVSYLYAPQEQAVITEMFRRLYACGDDPIIYVLISGVDYQKSLASGSYTPESLANAGFIHASPAAQLTRVANKYYKEVEDVRVLIVDLAKITSPVKWEPATGGLYPHIYGPMNMDAVVRQCAIHPGLDGVFDIQPGDLSA
jgi:uncharacterized protein (DUF952 family)